MRRTCVAFGGTRSTNGTSSNVLDIYTVLYVPSGTTVRQLQQHTMTQYKRIRCVFSTLSQFIPQSRELRWRTFAFTESNTWVLARILQPIVWFGLCCPWDTGGVTLFPARRTRSGRYLGSERSGGLVGSSCEEERENPSTLKKRGRSHLLGSRRVDSSNAEVGFCLDFCENHPHSCV